MSIYRRAAVCLTRHPSDCGEVRDRFPAISAPPTSFYLPSQEAFYPFTIHPSTYNTYHFRLVDNLRITDEVQYICIVDCDAWKSPALHFAATAASTPALRLHP